LITLTVTGSVQLSPPHPLDEVVAAAFNAHQRRTTGGRRLLGPDAADMAVRAFTELGRDVVVRASPWRLGPATGALTSAWLAGWLAAAFEQDPRLAAETSRGYASKRFADAAAKRMRVLVHHRDLFVRQLARRPVSRRPAAVRAAGGVLRG
jgi:hypothetical protein